MKQMKAKLVSAVVMLVVAAVMMSTASYAWFTISTAPEISDITATVSANGNLELAIDNGYADEAAVDTASKFNSSAPGSTTGDYATWGNLANLGQFFKSGSNNLVLLRPAAKDGTSLKTAKYGDDGRVKELVALYPQNAHTNLKGVKFYTLTNSAATSTNAAYAYSVDFWVRTNTNGKVSISTGALERASDALTSDTGKGSFMTNTNGLVTYELTVGNATYYLGPDTSGAAAGDAADKTYPIKVYSDKTLTTAVSNNEVFDFSSSLAAQKATLLVYIDGAEITNAKALLADTAANFNIQFKHSATLDPMDAKESVTVPDLYTTN